MKNKLNREEIEKKDKIREIFIMGLGIISVIGAFVSLFFLTGMTAAAIGPARSNVYGLVIILASLLVWSLVVVLYSRKNMRKKGLDIKKLVREARE